MLAIFWIMISLTFGKYNFANNFISRESSLIIGDLSFFKGFQDDRFLRLCVKFLAKTLP